METNDNYYYELVSEFEERLQDNEQGRNLIKQAIVQVTPKCREQYAYMMPVGTTDRDLAKYVIDAICAHAIIYRSKEGYKRETEQLKNEYNEIDHEKLTPYAVITQPITNETRDETHKYFMQMLNQQRELIKYNNKQLTF